MHHFYSCTWTGVGLAVVGGGSAGPAPGGAVASGAGGAARHTSRHSRRRTAGTVGGMSAAASIAARPLFHPGGARPHDGQEGLRQERQRAMQIPASQRRTA